MEIISRKRVIHFSNFLFFSAFGFGILVLFWYIDFYSKGGAGLLFSNFGTLIYYILLPLWLFANGIFLRIGKYKIFSISSFSLFLFFLTSLFIESGVGWHFYRTLFFNTIFLGMTAGGLYGGSIIIPMFLISIVFSAWRGILHFFDYIAYQNREVMKEIKDKRVYFLKKEIFHKIVPFLALFANYFNYKRAFEMTSILIKDFKFDLTYVKNTFLFALPLIVIGLSLWSFFAKKKKVYKILNFIILFLVLLPYLVVWFKIKI